MPVGKIVRWDPDRYFGFVRPDDHNGRDTFVHGSSLDFVDLQADTGSVNGVAVSYRLATRTDGRTYCSDVERLEE